MAAAFLTKRRRDDDERVRGLARKIRRITVWLFAIFAPDTFLTTMDRPTDEDRARCVAALLEGCLWRLALERLEAELVARVPAVAQNEITESEAYARGSAAYSAWLQACGVKLQRTDIPLTTREYIVACVSMRDKFKAAIRAHREAI